MEDLHEKMYGVEIVLRPTYAEGAYFLLIGITLG